MRLDSVRWSGGELIFATTDPEAIRLMRDFEPGDYELKAKKKRRSLDANAMCWAICDKIAKYVGITKEEVYRSAIQDVGVYTPLPIRSDAVEEFGRIWRGHGIGWVLDVVDDSKIPGYKLCFAYNGSSTYDKHQMSLLIEHLMQDAEALGIDVLSDRERSLLIDAWTPG